jgi:predicted RNA-binding Zn-ribbon protein involved in translation (DUF1610 family)
MVGTTGMYRRFTKDTLEPVVQASRSWADVLRSFGKHQNGGSRKHLQRRVIELGISTDHFVTSAAGWAQGVEHPGKRSTPEEILRVHRDLKIPQPARRLRRALIATGVPYVCNECGCEPVWNGRTLVLQVDHMNADRFDARKENLRFMCPNCHSQTENWGRKAA